MRKGLPDAVRPASAAAIRQRRRRLRQREGVQIIPVEVYVDSIEGLIRAGWTSKAEATDPATLAAVISDYIHCWANGSLPLPPARDEDDEAAA